MPFFMLEGEKAREVGAGYVRKLWGAGRKGEGLKTKIERLIRVSTVLLIFAACQVA